MALNQNQFAIIPVKGMMALDKEFGTLSCEIGSGSAGGLVPGQPVKRVDVAGGVPKVIECAANTDVPFGFIVYDVKDGSYSAGDKVTIASGWTDFMWMEAAEAFAPGAKLMIQITGTKVAVATAGKPICGLALDKATADGDLVRVQVILPGVFTA